MSLQYFPPSFLATQDEATLNDNVAIVDQPGELIATGNKNCIVLSSKELGPAVATISQLSIDGDIFEGDFIELVSQEMTIRMTAKDVPGLLEFQSTATAGSPQGVATDLARAFNDAVIFNRFYVADAFQAGAIVRITAKVTGSKFIIVQNHSGNSSAVSTVLGINGTRGQSLNNYGIYSDIFIGSDINFGFPIDKTNMELLGSIEKKYQPDNLMEVDVSGLLDSEPEFLPLVDQYPTLSFKPLYPWLALWGETYSTGETFRRKYLVGTTAVKWAIKAAQNVATYDDAELQNFIIEAAASSKRFLTFQPPSKRITRDGKEWLSNIFKADPSSFIRVAIYTIRPNFRDGTNGAEEVITSQFIPNGGIYAFNASPENLGLDVIEATAGKVLKGYTIQVRYATTIAQVFSPLTAPTVTVPQRYVLDVRCYDEFLNVAFMNKFGCWDGLQLNGEDNPTLTRRASTFVRSIPCNNSKTEFIRGSKGITTEFKRDLSTDWIDQRTATWLQDLAESPRVYSYPNNQLTATFVEKIEIRKDSTNDKYFAEITLIGSSPKSALKL